MLTYPHINPIALAIGPFRIHWYGIMYLIAFGAAWCAPSVEEIPHLRATFDAFRGDDRFAMLGLSLDDAIEDARLHAADQGLGWDQGFIGRDPFWAA